MLRYLFRRTRTQVHVYTEVELEEEEKQRLIREYHESPLGGHQGITRTFNRLYALYHWKGMRQQIREYLKKMPRLPEKQYLKQNIKTTHGNYYHS